MFRITYAVIIATVLASAPATAQHLIYAPPFTSNSAGEIKGTVTKPGLEEAIEILGYQHEVSNPVDAATGLPTGKRQHRPFTITKMLDRASPLLFDTLTKNGTIDELVFLFYRPTAVGTEEHFFTITLEEATISNIRQEKATGPLSTTLEYVSFTYDKITWEEVDVGVMAFDSWKQTRRAQ